MSGVALGALVLGAGAGVGSYYMNKPKKYNEINAVYGGPKPYESLTGFPVGSELNKTILAGLRGEGWGFPEGYIERSTSPFIEQLRVNAPKTQREVQDIYSARGLGRGIAAARDVSEVAAQRERDINQILANAYMADIAQRKADETAWQERGARYANQEVATRDAAARFGLAQMGRENEAALSNIGIRSAYDEANRNNLNASIATGLSTALGFGGGIGGLGAVGSNMIPARGGGYIQQPLYNGAPAVTPGYNPPVAQPRAFVGGDSSQIEQFFRWLANRR